MLIPHFKILLQHSLGNTLFQDYATSKHKSSPKIPNPPHSSSVALELNIYLLNPPGLQHLLLNIDIQFVQEFLFDLDLLAQGQYILI